MNEQTVLAILSGAVAIVAALINRAELLDRDMIKIKRQLDLYNRLPSESVTKKKLLKNIDRRVEEFIVGEQKLSRDFFGVSVALILMLTGGYLSWFFYERGSWWSIGLVFSAALTLTGLVGFIQDISRLERDSKGRPVGGDAGDS